MKKITFLLMVGICAGAYSQEKTTAEFFQELEAIKNEQLFSPELYGIKSLLPTSLPKQGLNFPNVVDFFSDSSDAFQCSEVASTLYHRFSNKGFSTQYVHVKSMGGVWDDHYIIEVTVGDKLYQVDFTPPFHQYMNEADIEKVKHTKIESKAPQTVDGNLMPIPLNRVVVPYSTHLQGFLAVVIAEAEQYAMQIQVRQKLVTYKDGLPESTVNIEHNFVFDARVFLDAFGSQDRVRSSLTASDAELAQFIRPWFANQRAIAYKYVKDAKNQRYDISAASAINNAAPKDLAGAVSMWLREKISSGQPSAQLAPASDKILSDDVIAAATKVAMYVISYYYR